MITCASPSNLFVCVARIASRNKGGKNSPMWPTNNVGSGWLTYLVSKNWYHAWYTFICCKFFKLKNEEKGHFGQEFIFKFLTPKEKSHKIYWLKTLNLVVLTNCPTDEIVVPICSTKD